MIIYNDYCIIYGSMRTHINVEFEKGKSFHVCLIQTNYDE